MGFVADIVTMGKILILTEVLAILTNVFCSFP